MFLLATEPEGWNIIKWDFCFPCSILKFQEQFRSFPEKAGSIFSTHKSGCFTNFTLLSNYCPYSILPAMGLESKRNSADGKGSEQQVEGKDGSNFKAMLLGKQR